MLCINFLESDQLGCGKKMVNRIFALTLIPVGKTCRLIKIPFVEASMMKKERIQMVALNKNVQCFAAVRALNFSPSKNTINGVD